MLHSLGRVFAMATFSCDGVFLAVIEASQVSAMHSLSSSVLAWSGATVCEPSRGRSDAGWRQARASPSAAPGVRHRSSDRGGCLAARFVPHREVLGGGSVAFACSRRAREGRRPSGSRPPTSGIPSASSPPTLTDRGDSCTAASRTVQLRRWGSPSLVGRGQSFCMSQATAVSSGSGQGSDGTRPALADAPRCTVGRSLHVLA